MNTQLKKATNLTLNSQLISEAREFKVNLSQAAEEGIRAALQTARAKIWKKDNISALESSNDYVKQHGLPLSGLRQF